MINYKYLEWNLFIRIDKEILKQMLKKFAIGASIWSAFFMIFLWLKFYIGIGILTIVLLYFVTKMFSLVNTSEHDDTGGKLGDRRI